VRLGPQGVEGLGDLARRHRLGALEQQVLEEMGGARLTGELIAGAGVHPTAHRDRPQRGHLLRDHAETVGEDGEVVVHTGIVRVGQWFPYSRYGAGVGRCEAVTGDRRPTMLEDLLRPEDRAVEAVVARYQRVAPAITRFARSLSGNQELLVRLGSEPASSPTEIVCDPRVFQAAYNRNAPVTPDEVALASALHEVVHLVSTDLDERRPIPGDWPRITEGPLPEEDLDLLTALERAGGPVSETFFFALEDARQECQGLSVYPGARSVLADLYRAAFPAAVSKSGPLSQFALGCFLIVGDYLDRSVLEKRFEARASVALDDATELLREASDASDPWEVAAIALKLTAIAKAHGLLTEPPPQSTPSQRRSLEKHDADQAAEGVDSVRLLSPVLQDSESYQPTRRAAQARSGE